MNKILFSLVGAYNRQGKILLFGYQDYLIYAVHSDLANVPGHTALTDNRVLKLQGKKVRRATVMHKL